MLWAIVIRIAWIIAEKAVDKLMPDMLTRTRKWLLKERTLQAVRERRKRREGR